MSPSPLMVLHSKEDNPGPLRGIPGTARHDASGRTMREAPQLVLRVTLEPVIKSSTYSRISPIRHSVATMPGSPFVFLGILLS